MRWQITRDKFLSKEERDQLLRATEDKAIIDLAKGRSTWVRRWMLVDLALYSGLRVSEITALRVGDLRLNGSEKLIYVREGKGGSSGYVSIDKTLGYAPERVHRLEESHRGAGGCRRTPSDRLI